MRGCCAPILLGLCAMLCSAQATKNDQALLHQARARYDAPFDRNLQSFDCAVEFSWREHFRETTRVGDEGTDDELERYFQPIRNRVSVSREKISVSSGLPDEAVARLPHGGMAESLLEHAVQKSLFLWLPAATNAMLPDASVPVSFHPSPSGYELSFRVQTAEFEMDLDPDMRLKAGGLSGGQSGRFETSFASGRLGYVLTSLIIGEDGNLSPGNRLIFTYTYQTVDGVELPERVAVTRESHHEVWRYALSGCTVRSRQRGR